MNIHPIKTELDYDNALDRIDELWGSPTDTPEGDELDVLIILVEAYEAEHYYIAPADPIESIKNEMEIKGLTRKDLEPFIGGRSRVSEILNGKRNLSIEMIRNLHKGLGIPLTSLIGV